MMSVHLKPINVHVHINLVSYIVKGMFKINKNNDIDNDKLQCFTKKLNFSINIKNFLPQNTPCYYT